MNDQSPPEGQAGLGVSSTFGGLGIRESPPSRSLRVYFSYTRADERSYAELEKHLKQLHRRQPITSWHAGLITAGTDAIREAGEHLDNADVIVLLVSADYLFSDDLYDRDVMPAMQRHEAKKARVIPVILRPCDCAGAPFADLASLPSDGRAVTEWPNLDAAWTDVAVGIRRVIEELRARGA